MEKIVVYHGSNVEVAVPRILQNGGLKKYGLMNIKCVD